MQEEIFTIGDQTQFGEISGFYICNDKEDIDYGKMMVTFKQPRANRTLDEIKKLKQPEVLLTMQDIENCTQRIDFNGYKIGFLDETKLKELAKQKINQ